MYVFLTGTIYCTTGQGEAEVSLLVAVVGDGVLVEHWWLDKLI